jgi:hypothetical protein
MMMVVIAVQAALLSGMPVMLDNWPSSPSSGNGRLAITEKLDQSAFDRLPAPANYSLASIPANFAAGRRVQA